MTVSFNTQKTAKAILNAAAAHQTFEQIYQEFKKEVAKISPAQTDVGYYFRMYVTHSEQQPVHWKFYDSSSFIQEEPLEYFKQLSKNMGAVKKDCGATGFKIVCIRADTLDIQSIPFFVSEYCVEQWALVKKTFINGPKKAPFPKKASGHF